MLLDTNIKTKIIRGLEEKLIKSKGEDLAILSASFDDKKRVLTVYCYYIKNNENFTEEIPYEELSYEE